MSFNGIIPAVLTPFTAADEVDTEALSANIAHLVDHGAAAFVATGTMGEAQSLSTAERRLVIETIVAAAAGRPVISGASAGSTAAACANAALARDAGCAGVMSLPPLNYNGTADEFAAFFAALADAAGGLPIMLYNNPGASGLDVSPQTIAHVGAAVPAVTCVKECSGDARRIAAIRELTDLDVLVGGDDWALEGYAAGAVGWVTGVGNVAPAECLALQEHVRAGRLDEARELWPRLLPLARLDMTPHLVQYFKGALDAVGLRGGPVRPPRLALDAQHQAILDAAVAALGVPAAA